MIRICATVLAFGLFCVGAMGDVTADFQKEAESIYAGVTELDKAWHDMLGWLPDKGACISTFDLTLASAIERKNDLKLRIYLLGDRPGRTIAWTPGWSRSEHEIEIIDYEVSPEDGGAALELTFHVRLIFDGSIPFEGKDWNAWFTVTGNLSDDTLSGTFAAVPPEDTKTNADITRARGRPPAPSAGRVRPPSALRGFAPRISNAGAPITPIGTASIRLPGPRRSTSGCGPSPCP